MINVNPTAIVCGTLCWMLLSAPVVEQAIPSSFCELGQVCELEFSVPEIVYGFQDSEVFVILQTQNSMNQPIELRINGLSYYAETGQDELIIPYNNSLLISWGTKNQSALVELELVDEPVVELPALSDEQFEQTLEELRTKKALGTITMADRYEAANLAEQIWADAVSKELDNRVLLLIVLLGVLADLVLWWKNK
ncbi:MAG: hypothetical protein GOU99_00025 [Candidatus Altiarchaeota archaeon]|nr:hypothetical protein [Candidatus Altiarchaeota archaeon]